MVKKIVSFIVILLVYCIIGAAVLIGTSNFGLGFGNNSVKSVRSAYSLDRAGDIYYINNTAEYKSLICIDSAGKKLFEKRLSQEVFGNSFVVDSIYVEHDKSIFLTVYEYDAETLFINRVSIHMFYEDGSYADEIFGEKLSCYMNSRAKPISSLSEDDSNVYFSLINGNKAEVFSAPKNNSEPFSKVNDFTLEDEPIYGSITTSSKELVVGRDGGLTVYTADGTKKLSGYTDFVFDRFWNAISGFYMQDSASGGIYAVSQEYAVSNVLAGSRIMNAEDRVSTAQMSDIAVGITGNIFGSVRAETERLYSGSFSVMSGVYTESVDKSVLINIVLAIAGVCVAIVLMTILTWDFYCSILKMRLSIMLRQSLMIAMLIFVALYSLSFFVIIPLVEEIVTEDYMHQSQLIANVMNDSINGLSESPSREEYGRYFNSIGEAAASADSDNGFFGDDEKPQIHLVENFNGVMKIIASSELYPEGYPAERLLHGGSFTKLVQESDKKEQFIISSTEDTRKMFLIRSIELSVTSNPVYLVVATRVSGLSQAVENIKIIINLFLVMGGLLLILFFMIVENITAGAVRKLKRSVDRIARGEYNAPIDIHTGDEIEDLSHSVKALSAHIVEKTTSLECLNNSYYRFVPLSFLKNLGETQIERVGKSLYAKKRMAVMFLRFNLSQPLVTMETEEIFESINSVLEQIIPIINANNGTAYNLLFNGFNAIFTESTEDALQAAIKIREVISAYNEIKRSRGKRSVDVRIVIGEDEVLLGFIGDDKRMEPTVVSTAINQAEEIERLCVSSGMYIVCTEAAYRSLPKQKYRSRCIGSFRCSDSELIRLYDMFDSDPYTLIKLKEQFINRFEVGVSLFEKKDFVKARSMFMDIIKYAADDGVSRNYMYLSEHNISSETKQLTYALYDKSN